jgi:hypothetical protein
MILAWWWTNLADQIDAPPPKRPRLYDRVHSQCRSPMDITKFLTILTSLVIFEAIHKNHRLEISVSSYYPLHLESQVMRLTHTFVYFTHQVLRFLDSDAFEQDTINYSIIQIIFQRHKLSSP